ncbi:MAG TPA: NAD-dependent epimerase/dehydratase family protein [Cellvibrio sp.]|nr:NAD-dependent epimerase/dehydratase family protein [Cellvibrio sp.]
MNSSPTISVQTHYQPGVALEDLELIVNQLATVWDALRNQHIFITGGTGFVGCWLLEALLWANEQLDLQLTLSVLTRNPAAFTSKAPHLATHKIINLIQGDVTNLQSIHGRFDIVIHAATDVAGINSNPLITFEQIVAGTKETLALAQRSHTQRYLLTSSGAVYGRQPEHITHLPEDFAGAPALLDTATAYGQGKRVSEWLTACQSNQQLHVGIARCFALIGPYLPLDAQFAAGNFIRDGLDNKTIAVNGDGTSCRSYLYAADMVIWLLRILFSNNATACYNLGSQESISIKELAETISHIIYHENRTAIAKQPTINSPIQRYIPDTSKAQRELGLKQYTDLHNAISKTIAWEQQRRKLINLYTERPA